MLTSINLKVVVIGSFYVVGFLCISMQLSSVWHEQIRRFSGSWRRRRSWCSPPPGVFRDAASCAMTTALSSSSPATLTASSSLTTTTATFRTRSRNGRSSSRNASSCTPLSMTSKPAEFPRLLCPFTASLSCLGLCLIFCWLWSEELH